jgi:large subunit ribosomal protein L21
METTMLTELPLDALLLCYGPLAVTIIGFIGFAVMTDLNARRTYLRRMDMRTEDEQPEDLEPMITRTVTAQTPAGARVTISPPKSNGEPVKAVPPKPAPAPSTPPPARPPQAVDDDLTKLEGIGPKISQALVAAGLNTFEKMAGASMEDFQGALLAAGINLAPSAESWAEQAGYAARGDWDGLDALQDRLEGGRYPSSDSE